MQKTTTQPRKPQGASGASKGLSEGTNSALAKGDLEKTQEVEHQGKAARMLKRLGIILSTVPTTLDTAWMNRFSRFSTKTARQALPQV